MNMLLGSLFGLQVLFTSEDLHRWDHPFSFLMVTTRKWAQDPTNIRILQYFTAVTEVYDQHYALQVGLVDFVSRASYLGFVIS